MILGRRNSSGLMGLALACWIVAVADGAAPIRILPLGDSITAGYTDSPEWTEPFSFGYRGPLWDLLKQTATEFHFAGDSPEPWNGWFGMPKQVVGTDLREIGEDHHRGYAGYGPTQLGPYIPLWLPSDKPDVILLMAGINEIQPGATELPDGLKSSLSNLVTSLRNVAPHAYILVAEITPYARETKAIVQYNQYIRETLVPSLASEGVSIRSVDQYSNFLDAAGHPDPSLFANEFQHPSRASYERMARTWFKGITDLLLVRRAPEIVGRTLLRCEFQGAPGQGYSVEKKTADSAWEPAGSILADDRGVLTLETSISTREPAVLYQVTLPAPSPH